MKSRSKFHKHIDFTPVSASVMSAEVTASFPHPDVKFQWIGEPIPNFVASRKGAKISSLVTIPPLLSSLSFYPSVVKHLTKCSKLKKVFFPALVKAREVADFAAQDLETALLNVSKVYFLFLFLFFLVSFFQKKKLFVSFLLLSFSQTFLFMKNSQINIFVKMFLPFS